MLCQFQNCGNGNPIEAQIKCCVCLKLNLYCEEHGLAHRKCVHKKVMYLDDDYISELLIEAKKVKIKECINKILKDCKDLVSWIEKCACDTIKELKDFNNSIKNIGEFKILRFEYKKVLEEIKGC